MSDDAAPVIRTEGLTKTFLPNSGFVDRLLPGDLQSIQALNGVDLEIKRGEILGLVGESGCGKTTLGKTILRLHEPTAGRIYFDGTDITDLPQRKFRAYRKDMQIIFQDPYSSLNPKMTAGEIIKEPMAIHGLYGSAEGRRNQAFQLLEEVGLSETSYDKYPYEFSGGQRQRVMIAKALATDPSFVVADEPVSALDVSTQARILNLLKRLQRERDFTCLFIGHNISAVKFISDRMAVMYLGEIAELGRSDDVISNPHHPYTEALISSIPEPGVSRENRIILDGTVPSPDNPPSGCSFHPRCPYATEECTVKNPALEMTAAQREVACHNYQAVLESDSPSPQSDQPTKTPDIPKSNSE